MDTGSIITLRRASYSVTDPPRAIQKTGIKLFDNFQAYLQKVAPNPPITSEQFCFSLLLGDGSQKNFCYQPRFTEAESLQNAVNFAVASGFHADTKTIALFSKGRIDEVFFQKRTNRRR